MEPTKRTIITVAQSRGSAAKSKSGAWKYLLTHMSSPIRGLVSSDRGHHTGKYDAYQWRESRMERRADGRARVLGYPLQSEQWTWYCEAYQYNQQWDMDGRTALDRNQYGAIASFRSCTSQDRTTAQLYRAALDIVHAAQSSGVITAAHDTIGFDRKGRADGSALHYELFDFSADAALVCARHTEGTRYGVKTLSKTYLLLTRTEIGITSAITIEPIAKLAKSGAAYGSIIARIRGEEGAAKLPPIELSWAEGYKALALAEDGSLHSIFSGEQYELGETMRERASDNHGGGYYFYPTPEQALQCDVPNNSKMLDAPRVVVRCEVAGREIEYGNGKLARTYLRPVEVVASRLA